MVPWWVLVHYGHQAVDLRRSHVGSQPETSHILLWRCCGHGGDQGPIQQQLCHHTRVKVLPRATIRERAPRLLIYNVLSFVISCMQSLSQYSFVTSPSGSQLAVCQLLQIPFQVLFFWVSLEILYVNLSFSKYPKGLRVWRSLLNQVSLFMRSFI
jgi:hypothetical protein